MVSKHLQEAVQNLSNTLTEQLTIINAELDRAKKYQLVSEMLCLMNNNFNILARPGLKNFRETIRNKYLFWKEQGSDYETRLCEEYRDFFERILAI